MVCYEEIRPLLNTGDIVLFSGKSFISWLIKKITGSPWSHVGLVLKSQELDSILIWESTTLNNIPNIENGRIAAGVQISSLSERIRHYNGTVGIRLLEARRTPEFIRAMIDLKNEVRGYKYEQNKIKLIRSALDLFWWQKNRKDLRSIFCSELVAEAYQRVGLLDTNKVSSEYTPSDFGGHLIMKTGVLQLVMTVMA